MPKKLTLHILAPLIYRVSAMPIVETLGFTHVAANRRRDISGVMNKRETLTTENKARDQNAVGTIVKDVKVVLQLCRCEGDFHNNEIQEACSTQP
jgi:hypothetical protein